MGQHTAVGGDEEVGWQAEAPTVRNPGRDRPTADNCAKAAKHRSHDWRPGARVEQGSGRGFNTELGIEPPIRVSDNGERQIRCVMQQLLRARMEHDYLTNRGRREFVVPLHDGMQVQVA